MVNFMGINQTLEMLALLFWTKESSFYLKVWSNGSEVLTMLQWFKIIKLNTKYEFMFLNYGLK